MNEDKLSFLKNDLVPLLRKLQPGEKGAWGKMDAQQMVEHFAQALEMANGKRELQLYNPDVERLQKIRMFLMSETPFKENTKSPALGNSVLRKNFAYD